MALKSSVGKLNRFSIFHVALCLSTFALMNAQKYLNEKDPCYRPRCYKFLRSNSSNVIEVETGRTGFCYEGLQQSFFHLWANPVLRTKKHFPSRSDEIIKFVAFYGSSLEEAEAKSEAPVNTILQNWITSVQTVKHTEDISLSAFNNSCVVIQSNVNYTARIELRVIDFWFIFYLATGIILFFSAKTWCRIMGITWADVKSAVYDPAEYLGLIEVLSPVWAGALGFYEENKSFIWWMFPDGPKFSEWSDYLRNTTLHYGTGVSVGVVASILILLFILARFLPSKLRTLCYILLAMGTSASVWALQSITEILSESMLNKLAVYWHYVLGYVLTMGLLSFGVVYKFGPVTDTRTLNLIQWLLQLVGLILIYNGTQIREVSVALIIITFMLYNLPRVWLSSVFNNQSSRNFWYRFFPPKIRLLTEEEYIQEGNQHTKEELEKLRDFCRSPECKPWEVIGKLKSPQRFADFVLNDASHISDEEMLQHTQESISDSEESDTNQEYTDNGSELAFVLGHRNMRVSLSS